MLAERYKASHITPATRHTGSDTGESTRVEAYPSVATFGPTVNYLIVHGLTKLSWLEGRDCRHELQVKRVGGMSLGAAGSVKKE